MQYAIVETNRLEAFPGGSGLCPICGARMIAKCGPRLLHHWAHAGRKNCDPWRENETPWHREWKNHFPASCREVSHLAPDGEIHRADIKTSSGIIIEIQHSPMTDAERSSREHFYRNLAWVLDGAPFRSNFDIYHPLPDPHSEEAQDIVWTKARRHRGGSNAGVFFRLSEYRNEHPGASKADVRTGLMHSISEIKLALAESYCGHHQYDWIRPRATWLDASCPVYIDLGDDFLARLEKYDESGLPCIRLVAKQKFIHDAMTESSTGAIATRFYPLPQAT
jgi:hypothetical protein